MSNEQNDFEFSERILPRRLATQTIDEEKLGLEYGIRGVSTLKSSGHDDHEDE